jgi:hypothetical protein
MMIPQPIPIVGGFLLISIAIVLLNYCLNRDGYFVYIGFFGGAVPFIIGAMLIMSSFLPDPPPIFGFTISTFYAGLH